MGSFGICSWQQYGQINLIKRCATTIIIEEAIKYEGKNTTILEHLGDIYFKLKDKSKALNLWQKAFDLDQSKIEIKRKIEKGEL